MKLRTFLCLLLVFPSLLFAQANAEQAMNQSAYYQATDANNRTLKLPQKPEHILIAGKAAIMPANALFLFPESQTMTIESAKTDQGLGDFFSFLRPDLDQKPRLAQNASVEELATKNSDVILTKTSNYEALCKKLDQLGIPNYTMNLETYDQWMHEINELGKLLKDTARAKQILALYDQRMQKLTDTVKAIPKDQQKRVLILQADRTDNTYAYKIAPDSWMQTWMVQTINAIPVWEGANTAANGWSTVSFEQIAAWDPDIIILVNYRIGSDQYLKAVYDAKPWAQLKAVKNHQVLASPSDMMNYIQPVASWILGLQWMAKTVYPDQFANMDMASEVASFYRDFYGIKEAQKLQTLVDAYQKSIAENQV